MSISSRLLTTDVKLLVAIAGALLACQAAVWSQELQKPPSQTPGVVQPATDRPEKSSTPVWSGKWQRRAANPEEIARWIKELGDNRFRVREEASKALEEVGNPAQEALAQAVKSPDIEVQRRAKQISELIEINEAIAPTLISLKLDDAPLPEAVAELGRQSPLKLELTPQQGMAREQLEKKRISLTLEQVPFWEGLERLCQTAGLCYSPTAAQTLQLQLAQGLPAIPTAGSGAFRFRVTGSQYFRTLNLTGTVAGPQAPGAVAPPSAALPLRSEQLSLSVDVVTEPRITILSLGPPQLSEAKDDANESLLTEGQPTGNFAPAIYPGYAGPSLLQAIQRQVNLRPPTRPATTLKILKGILPVEVTARRRPLITVDNVQEAKGKVLKGKGDLFLVILQVQDHGNGGSIRFLLTGVEKVIGEDRAPGTPASPRRWSPGYTDTYRPHFELSDAQGRPYNLSLNVNYPNDPAQMDILEGSLQYSVGANAGPAFAGPGFPGPGFPGPVFAGPANAGPPIKLTFFDLKRIRGNVPFEIHDVPLP